MLKHYYESLLCSFLVVKPFGVVGINELIGVTGNEGGIGGAGGGLFACLVK